MDSCDQFLAVAEHRLIPSRARSVGHFLREAGHQSVWALPVRIRLLVVMLGLGLSVWVPPLLLLPTFATAGYLEFLKLGRALRVTLPAGNGEVVHLFVENGYQGAEEDAEKLQLTEARVVCTDQPVLTAGILMLILLCPCFGQGHFCGSVC